MEFLSILWVKRSNVILCVNVMKQLLWKICFLSRHIFKDQEHIVWSHAKPPSPPIISIGPLPVTEHTVIYYGNWCSQLCIHITFSETKNQILTQLTDFFMVSSYTFYWDIRYDRMVWTFCFVITIRGLNIPIFEKDDYDYDY
jgi:hypothetical protein